MHIERFEQVDTGVIKRRQRILGDLIGARRHQQRARRRRPITEEVDFCGGRLGVRTELPDLLGSSGHGCRHGRRHGRMGHRHADPRHHASLALDLLQDERPHCGCIQVYNERRWPLCGHARQYSTHYPAGGDAVFLPYF